MSHNPFRVGGQPVEEMYGIMTKISSVSSQNQLLMLKNAPEFTKIMIGEICTSLQLNVEKFFFSIHRLVILKTMYGQKKKFLYI